MSSGGSGGKIVLIVLGIVGGVLLLVTLSCVGVIIVIGMAAQKAAEGIGKAVDKIGEEIKSMQEAQITAENFLDDLSSGQVDTAYNSTTANFKKTTSQQEFRKLVSSNPGLKNPQRFVGPANVSASTARTTATINSPDGGFLECTINLAKEDNKWKVDKFTVTSTGSGFKDRDKFDKPFDKPFEKPGFDKGKF